MKPRKAPKGTKPDRAAKSPDKKELPSKGIIRKFQEYAKDLKVRKVTYIDKDGKSHQLK